MTKRTYIEVFQAQKSGIVWASEKDSSWATTGFAYRPSFARRPSAVIVALLRLGSVLAQRLNALSLIHAAAEGIMEAVNEAALGDGDWHKDPDICRENLAGRY